jgi:flavin reductase (DIM6/NTAB) family NADH-FMN oxidoreductase RutF
MQHIDIQQHVAKSVVSPKTGTFRDAMRQLPGGVSVITVGRGDDRSGMTVTSVSSLAVEPATVIVCVNKQSSTWQLLQRYGAFGVNVLTGGQQSVADRFSGRGGIKGPERYAGEDWITLATGTPLLANALAALDCDVEETIDRHSHAIVIGRVQAVQVSEQGAGLIYWQGQYGPSQNELPAAVRAWRAK